MGFFWNTIRGILVGCMIALVTAIILRVLLPVPILTGFAVLFFFFLLQLVESRFETGLGIAKNWTKMGLSAVLALVLMLVLRFLAGQAFDLYPIETYDIWRNGGAIGIFWGKKAAINIIWEILFAAVAAKLAFDSAFGKRRWIVSTIFVVSFLVLTFQHQRPKFSALLAEGFTDDALVERHKRTVEATKVSAELQLPDCAETKAGIEARFDKAVDLPLNMNCWSGEVVLPQGANFNFRVENPGGRIQYRFWDGIFSPVVPADGSSWLGYNIRNARFRLRGEGVATITVERH